MNERAYIVLSEAIRLARKHPDITAIEVREIHHKSRRPGANVALTLRMLTPYSDHERGIEKVWTAFELEAMPIDLIHYAVGTVFEQLGAALAGGES